MNADELIALLQALTPEERLLPVYLEGCDCSNEAKAVSVKPGDVLTYSDYVLVEAQL